jgi:hypothetical protein
LVARKLITRRRPEIGAFFFKLRLNWPHLPNVENEFGSFLVTLKTEKEM